MLVEKALNGEEREHVYKANLRFINIHEMIQGT